MSVIQLEKLVKHYDGVEVLHGIDLQMESHEFTALVGPSGCGKSTTLRMIAGLETVTSREIYIDGQAVSHMDPKDRGLAMVFQDYALYPHMDVARNISFALRLQKLPKDKIHARVKHVADMVGLTDLLHRKPRALSGGQRQRVAMARAIAKDSEIFLLDEPLSNLDAKLRGKMRAELALIHKKVQKNMIYVTHDQIEAMTLADRIVVMHNGYIQQQGIPSDLFLHPKNKFVAGFLGTPPMNFLMAELQEIDGKVFAKGDSFCIEIPAEKVRGLESSSRKVIFGIRPSDLFYDEHSSPNTSFDLTVRVIEYIGAQTVLLCSCGNADITVEIKSEIPINPETPLRFAVRPEGIHLFDRKTEKSLLQRV